MNSFLQRLRTVLSGENLDREEVKGLLDGIGVEDLIQTDEKGLTLLHSAVKHNSLVVVAEICEKVEAMNPVARSRVMTKRDRRGRDACLMAVHEQKDYILEIFMQFEEIMEILLEQVYADGLKLIDHVLEVETPNLVFYSKLLEHSPEENILSNGDYHLQRLCSLNVNQLSPSSKAQQIPCIKEILRWEGNAEKLILEPDNVNGNQAFMLAIRSGNIELISMFVDIVGTEASRERLGDLNFGNICLEMLCPIRRNAVFSPGFVTQIVEMFGLDLNEVFKNSSICQFVFTIDCFGPNQDEFVLWLLQNTEDGVNAFSEKISQLIEFGAVKSLSYVLETLGDVELGLSHLPSAIKGYMRNVRLAFKFNESVLNAGEMFQLVELAYDSDFGFSRLEIATALHPFRFERGFYLFSKFTKFYICKNLIEAIEKNNFLAAETIVTFIELLPTKKKILRRRPFRPSQASKGRIFEQTTRLESEARCCFCQQKFIINQKRKQVRGKSLLSFMCEQCYYGDAMEHESGLQAMEFARRLGRTKFYNLIKFALSDVGIFLRKKNLMFLSENIRYLGIQNVNQLQRLLEEGNLQETGISWENIRKLHRALRQ